MSARFGTEFTPHLLMVVLALLPFFAVLQWVYYNVGDQRNYLAYYLNAATASPLEAYLGQRMHTGSSEPVYFFVSYAAAKLGIPYSAYKVAISLALASSTALLLSRLRVAAPIILLFLILNFYWLALYTELERFAIAVVFLQLGILRWLDERRKVSLGLLIASSFCHFQITILLASILMGFSTAYIIAGRSSLRRRVLWLGVFVILMLGALLMVLVLSGIAFDIIDTILRKLIYYKNLNPRNLLQAAAMLPIYFYLSRGRVDFLFSYFFVCFFVLIIGGERLNIVLIMLALFAGFYLRRAQDPLMMLLLSYLFFKGLGFILNIALTGRGY